jgi:hypothetical protein
MNKQLIIFSLVFLLSLSFVSAGLFDNIVHYWKLDDGNSLTVIDSLGLSNGVKLSGSPKNQSGIILSAYNMTNSSSIINFSNTYIRQMNRSFAVNFWVYGRGADTVIETTYPAYISSGAYGNNGWVISNGGESNGIKLGTWGSELGCNAHIVLNRWNMATLVMLANNTEQIYINGVLNCSAVVTANIGTSALANGQLGCIVPEEQTNSSIDEVGIWNRTLSASEITTLYNGGAGYGYNQSDISIKLISPINNSVYSSTNISFMADYNISGTNNQNYSWRNTTYYVWYSNGTLFNQTFKTISGNNTEDTLEINNFTTNNYKWNALAYYGNNTFRNYTWSENNNTFVVGASYASSSYNLNIFETSKQTLTANFNILNNSQISLAQLIYNGTTYTISNVTIIGNSLTVSKTINIPLNFNATANQSNDFYFRFTYAGNSIQTSDIFYQNSSYIDLRRCGAYPYNLTALNFSLYDERNLTKISPTVNPISFAATFRYWLGDGTIYKNYSYQMINSSAANANNFTFCIYPYLPNNYTFKTDLDNLFSAQDYSENEYYLRNATLTNNTAQFDLFLYLLGSGESTKFYVTVKQGITFINGALTNIAKYFVGGGQYKTTAIKITDIDGKFPAYLDLDSKYLFSIVKDGQVLGIIEKTASCSVAPCSIELNLGDSTGSAFDYYNSAYASNVYSNLSFNPTTNMVTYTFVDITGLANYFRLLVTQSSYNQTTSATICNLYSYSSAGTMSCNVTGYMGDFSAIGYISRSPEKIDKIIGFFISDALHILGLLGIFLNIAIIITVVLAVAATTKGNPSAIIFMLGLTIVLLKIGGLFPFSWAVVVPIELAIVWAIMKSKT